MPDDKTHLYTKEDQQRDIKNTAKRKEAAQFAGFSTAGSTVANLSTLIQPPPTIQAEYNPNIGDPINDTYGSIGNVSQIISLNVYGSNYSIMKITGDVTFAFVGIPQGRHIEFSLDIMIDKESEPWPVIMLPQLTNPISLPELTNGTRLILKFVGVHDSSSTRFTYIGGTIGGGSGGDGANKQLSNLENVAVNTSILPARDGDGSIGNLIKKFGAIYGDIVYGDQFLIQTSLDVFGTVVLGQTLSNSISIQGGIVSNLVPAVGGTYDLGREGPPLIEWNNLFVKRVFTGLLRVTARVDSNLLPQDDNKYTLGNSGLKWSSVHSFGVNADSINASELLISHGNTQLGNAISNTIGFIGRLNTDIIPSQDGRRSLGTSNLKWFALHVDRILSDVTFLGDTTNIYSDDIVLGLSQSDTISILGRVRGSIVPDGTFALGQRLRPWKEVYVDGLVSIREGYGSTNSPRGRSGTVILFARPGAGGTRLMAKFGDGSPVEIAREP